MSASAAGAEAAPGSLAPAFRRLLAAYRLVSRGNVEQARLAPAAIRAGLKRFLMTCALEPEAQISVSRLPGSAHSDHVARTLLEAPGAERTLLYVHGGGLVFHDVETFVPFLARLARLARCRIVTFDYPKAPECGARRVVERLNDALEVEAARVFAAEGRLYVMGDSIGALAALLASWQRLRSLRPNLALLCPLVEPFAGRGFASQHQFARGFFLEQSFLDWFRELAVEGFGSATWPLRAPSDDYAALGSLLVWSAGCDMLRDEAAALAARAREANGLVEYRELPGLPHDFALFAARVPEAEAAIELIGERLAAWLRQN